MSRGYGRFYRFKDRTDKADAVNKGKKYSLNIIYYNYSKTDYI
jgi:hypothetical protein